MGRHPLRYGPRRQEPDSIEHFADKLLTACRDKGAPICVGIDPVYERLPPAIRHGGTLGGADDDAHRRVELIDRFVTGVLEAVAPHAPCVKFQSACFERYLWPGVEAYHRLIHRAHQLGLVVINDAKRGDIDISAAHYAAGCLADVPFADLGELSGPDAMTVNAYLGPDGLQPFMDQATGSGKGVFALVRTSNPGGDAVQSLPLKDGRTVAQAVAQMIARLGSESRYIGDHGYSVLGAVVGATKAPDIAQLRQLMPQQLFLVPGYGAQGGSTQAVKACFKPDGTGAIITASRWVIYAHESHPAASWRSAVEQATIEFKSHIASMVHPSP